MTFDKKFYEFAGECSYLLARDFINGHFSVVVNYADRGWRKSITVFSGDRQVEMTTDGRSVAHRKIFLNVSFDDVCNLHSNEKKITQEIFLS